MKKLTLLIALLVIFFSGSAQEKNSVENIFKGTRLINGQSANLVKHGKLLLLIQHRFGDINGGAYQLFGLDQATMRLGFEYGLGENINVGIGRSTFMKTYDLFGKVRFAQQNSDFPLTVVATVGGSLPTIKHVFPATNNSFSDKFSGNVQLHLARTFGDIGIQLSPGYLNTGYLPVLNEKLSVFTMGVGGALKLSKKVSFNLEYLYNSSSKITAKKPLSASIDITSGEHLFQLLFSNSQQMFNQALYTQTSGDWTKGNIYFGFNLIRKFRLKYY
ncbi:MAG TPA: DUF5777 family beta-barrel protein [Draconibacterium sp.]|nr:DUF5777 family beta-barrel protein [Draconibacterium sp.]